MDPSDRVGRIWGLAMSPRANSTHRNDIYLASPLTLAFGTFILWIIYKADTGQANVFIDLVRPIPFGDKVAHAALYGLLTLGVNASSRYRVFWIGRFACYRGSLAVAVFALMEELSQMYIPARAWDGSDLVADAVGIVLFSVLSARLDAKTYERNHSRK